MTQARILVVEDDNGLREALVDTLLLGGYECREVDSGERALLALSRQRFDMVISDIQMGGMDGLTLLANIRQQYPQVPVLLMTAYANIDGAVRAMREGAIDYLAKPFSPEVLLNQVSRYVPAQKVEKRAVVYGDPRTAELFQLATRVARSEATVMVTGPSGTGKEVLARYIHDHSNRAEQAFVAINCAAIPENMLEATLFGYEKGAFTGAVQGCPGKFEQAQGGTLLLDEITEMDLGLQAKLLRVLQEKEVERLGSRKMIPLDVRVIATSNRDLKKRCRTGCSAKISTTASTSSPCAGRRSGSARGTFFPWRSICWRCMPARWGCRRRSLQRAPESV
jgi:two-component system response regulator FlrC